jgi:glycosyltransferase involved in cell wall biosynthesis
MSAAEPALVVFSSLFPSEQEPLAGVFIRERMFRVAEFLPVTVVSPQPWFPLQWLLRLWWPGYRPARAAREVMSGIEVLRPRFLALPGILRRFDGFFMALASIGTVRRLAKQRRADIIDAHFGYPDGYAASLVAGWLQLPLTVTLRGTETRHASEPALRSRLAAGLQRAERVFSVSASLRDLAVALGVPSPRTCVVGNGVDLTKFASIPRAEARRRLGLAADARVLISVGALVERKGFHRVIECLPALLEDFPRLHYVVVGGPSPEGDIREQLRAQVVALGLQQRIHFLGPTRPEELRVPLSAADLFVLATSNEGWANVLLEAMACGLPVVTTRVGGNAEVVSDDALGILVPFGDADALRAAIAESLGKSWDASRIRLYAEENSWDHRIEQLVAEFRRLYGVRRLTAPADKCSAGVTGRPLRVCVVGPLPPPPGGMANQTLQLARFLSEEGLKVSVVQTNAAFRPAFVGRLRGLRAVHRLLPYVCRLWSAMRDADVVHLMANSGWSWFWFAVPAAVIARLRGVPLVINYRGGEAEPFLEHRAWAVRPIVQRAAALAVPSRFLQGVFGRFGMAATIVPNIIDLTRFQPGPPRGGRNVHLIVTRNLEPLYDNATAIRALALVREEEPDARLTIAGEGPLRRALEQLAMELGVADAVRFCGRVDHAEIPALYASADICLNPSLADNMPNALLEALASGVPVVSTNVGGVPYLVEHERTALLVKAGDASSMADAVLRLVRDTPLRNRLKTAGLDHVRRFDWSCVRPQLLRMYESVSKRSVPAGADLVGKQDACGR